MSCLKLKYVFFISLLFNVIDLLLLVLFSSFLSPPTFYTQTFPFQQEFDLDIMLQQCFCFFCLVLLLLTPPRVSQQYQYFFFMHSFIFSIQHCASNDYSYLINLFSHSILINNFAFSSLIFNFILSISFYFFYFFDYFVLKHGCNPRNEPLIHRSLTEHYTHV